jgi:hypothetical protein
MERKIKKRSELLLVQVPNDTMEEEQAPRDGAAPGPGAHLRDDYINRIISTCAPGQC